MTDEKRKYDKIVADSVLGSFLHQIIFHRKRPLHMRGQFALLGFGFFLILVTGCNGSPTILSSEGTQPAVAPEAVSTSGVATTIAISTTAQGNTRITTSAFVGVIFSEKNAKETLSTLTSEGTWLPTAADIQDLETRLVAYLPGASPNFSSTGQTLANVKFERYERQYVGFIDKGQRKIYVNLFCGSGSMDWENQWVSARGGGICYLNVEYDPNTTIFSNLFANAPM